MTESSRADVTVDFDHHSADLPSDPYATWTALRGKCPVTWSTAYDGFWVLTDYASVFRASRDDETFTSGPPGGVAIPADYGVELIPIMTDAPMTQKYRRLLQPRLSPAAAAQDEPAIQAIADEVMDGFVERGDADMITEFSTPVPARFILRLLGFDEGRWAEFVGWLHAIVHGITSDPATAFESAAAFYGAMFELIEERRATGFRDDIMSMLLQSEIDGEPLADELVANYVLLLVFGGLDTTSASLGHALIRLERDPDLRRTLIEHPELIPAAIEEFLRVDTPVQALARTVSRGTEMCGQQLKEGDRALLVWGAANRDPGMFPDPEQINLQRPDNRHLAFGVGLHRCLGSNHGRTMFRIMLDTVLSRIPDYKLTADPAELLIPDASSVWGHHHLPARFTPGPRLGQPASEASVAS